MCPQIACLSGCIITQVAFLWLFSNVSFHMGPQRTWVSACKITQVTFVWLFSTVCFQMCPQRVYLVEKWYRINGQRLHFISYQVHPGPAPLVPVQWEEQSCPSWEGEKGVGGASWWSHLPSHQSALLGPPPAWSPAHLLLGASRQGCLLPGGWKPVRLACSPQMACPKRCIITQAALVGLIPTVCFHMSPQITFVRGHIIALTAFVQPYGTFILVLGDFLILFAQVLIFKCFFHFHSHSALYCASPNGYFLILEQIWCSGRFQTSVEKRKWKWFSNQ